MVQREEFQQFLSDLAQEGYQISYKEYDVHTLTGLPVNERKLYIIGVRTDLGKAYAFLEKDYIPLCFEKDILEQGHVDERYYKITSDLSVLNEKMMDLKLKEQRKPAEYLSDMLDDMLINLEK